MFAGWIKKSHPTNIPKGLSRWSHPLPEKSYAASSFSWLCPFPSINTEPGWFLSVTWAVVAHPCRLREYWHMMLTSFRWWLESVRSTEVKQNLKEQQLLRQPFWCLLLATGLWQHHNLGMTQHDYPPFRDVERLRIWKISIFAMGTTISAMISHHFNLSWDGRNQF